MARVMFAGGLGALMVTASICVPAQTPPESQPVFRTGAGEVLVDAIVRDKRGRLLRKLKPGDLQVFENGVEQQVTSFREIQGAGHFKGTTGSAMEPTVQSAGGARGAVQVDRQIRLVSLVFEGLSNQGRRAARQAAKDFLQADLGPNVYYAVFYINRTFRTVLSYTNNQERIHAAIDEVTGWEKAPIATPTLDLGAQSGGGSFAERGFASSVAAMSGFNQRMDTDMMGAVNVFGNWGIISELGRMPGRKSMLFFSEGLTLSANYRQHYLSMVSAANRANVSIYTIDARGLSLPAT